MEPTETYVLSEDVSGEYETYSDWVVLGVFSSLEMAQKHAGYGRGETYEWIKSKVPNGSQWCSNEFKIETFTMDVLRLD